MASKWKAARELISKTLWIRGFFTVVKLVQNMHGQKAKID